MPENEDAEYLPALSQPGQQKLFQMLENLVSSVPSSDELASVEPSVRAREIVRNASLKAGAVSAGLAIPPGPLGMLTILPDLMQVWRIQQQMVSDIAACYGQSAQLNRQTMVYCLFRHGAAMLARDILVRVGERLILKRGSLRVIQKILQRVTIKVTQRAIGKSISRWIPLIGPVAVGGYSLLYTRSVGKTAIDTFSKVIEIEPEPNPWIHMSR